MVKLSVRSEVLSDAAVSSEVKPSNKVKQMDSWESLLGGRVMGSCAGQKRTGAVLRRLKTVRGLGTGFTVAMSLSESLCIAARHRVELFLNTSEPTGSEALV